MASSSVAPDAKTDAPEADAPKADKAAPEDLKATSKADKDEAVKEDKDKDKAPAEPEISLHQYLRVSGVQPDQSAGFVRWSQKSMSGRHPLNAWKQALADFWRAPAR